MSCVVSTRGNPKYNETCLQRYTTEEVRDALVALDKNGRNVTELTFEDFTNAVGVLGDPLTPSEVGAFCPSPWVSRFQLRELFPLADPSSAPGTFNVAKFAELLTSCQPEAKWEPN